MKLVPNKTSLPLAVWFRGRNNNFCANLLCIGLFKPSFAQIYSTWRTLQILKANSQTAAFIDSIIEAHNLHLGCSSDGAKLMPSYMLMLHISSFWTSVVWDAFNFIRVTAPSSLNNFIRGLIFQASNHYNHSFDDSKI